MKKKIISIVKTLMKKLRLIYTNIQSFFHMRKFINLFLGKGLIALCAIILICALCGVALDYKISLRMPYFKTLLISLLFCLCSTLFTTHLIVKTIEEIHPAEDNKLLELYTKNEKNMTSQYIYLPMIFFGITVPVSTFILINTNVNIVISVYCFLGLFNVVFFCTLGAIQYFLLLMFIHNIRLKINDIKKYNKFYPPNTSWYIQLAKTAHTCNIFFLLVGLTLIFDFSVFCFSGKFGIGFSGTINILLLTFFWIVIFLFIITGAILLTIFSNRELFFIYRGLIKKKEAFLEEECSNNTDVYLKNIYATQMMQLLDLSSKVDNWGKRLFSFTASFVNLIASIEATKSFVLNLIPAHLFQTFFT